MTLGYNYSRHQDLAMLGEISAKKKKIKKIKNSCSFYICKSWQDFVVGFEQRRGRKNRETVTSFLCLMLVELVAPAAAKPD